MIVTIHQPECLPWLGFFDKMRQADVFVLLDNVQFSKNDFQNRNRIKTISGPAWLTIPVYTSGRSKQLIKDTEIFNDRKWRKRCWGLVDLNYRASPCFDQYGHFFKDLFEHHWSKLVDFNCVVIKYLAEQFGLGTHLISSSRLGANGHGPTQVIFRICQELGADIYLSGKHGRDYLDEEPFLEHGIDVKYQEFHHPIYPQQWGDFVANMSAVDLLFNCGHSSLEIISKVNQPQNGKAGSGSRCASR